MGVTDSQRQTLTAPELKLSGGPPTVKSAVRERVRALVVVGVVVVPLVVVLAASQIVPDALWFREVGQQDAFRHILEVKVLIVGVVGCVTAAFLFGNAWLALRGTRSRVSRAFLFAAAAGCLVIAARVGWSAMANWQVVLLWTHGQSFGVKDPLYHRDIGFFVFSLPFLLKLSNLLILIGALGAAAALIVHTVTGAIAWRPLKATRPARVHLALLGSLALLLLAWRLHLANFSAEFKQAHPGASAAFPGPHYADVHARILGLRVLSYVAVVAAICLAAAPFLATHGHPRAARRAVIVPLAALVALALVAQLLAPTLLQRFVVSSDPFGKEAPFLAHGITGTRRAFGLNGIDVHRFVPNRKITGADLRENRSKLDDVQLWDTDVARLEMRQLDSNTPFYEPAQPTLDLPANAKADSRLTLVTERELGVNRVRGSGRGWANNRLVYTHGSGAFRFSASQTNGAGLPSPDDRLFPLRQPRVYFGRQQPNAPSWVVANTTRAEFGTPRAANSRRPAYHYRGSGGIALSSPWLRALFALRLASFPLLASKEIRSHSRIIMHRDVIDRLRTIAPFIRWDPQPSTLIVGGRIVFLASGYTVSNSYPYSQRIRLAGASVSYARLAVEATVDAYSGKVRLYTVDRKDPILRAWIAAFPRMFKAISSMPQAIRSAMRYPPALFGAQAQLYQRFHTSHRQAFASGADAWSMPISLSGPIEVAADIRFDQGNNDQPQHSLRPAYSLGTPAGGDQRRLLLSAYYTPVDAQNLVADLEGWVTKAGRFELSSRSLPRARVTLGPAQVSRRVFLNSRVQNVLGVRNKELSDIGKSSLSSVWLGRPRIVFLAGGILQIQTVYNVSSGQGVAQRLGETVFLDGRAGIGKTVAAALRQALNPPRPVTRHSSPAPSRAVRPIVRVVKVRPPTGTHVSPQAPTTGGPASAGPTGGRAKPPRTYARPQPGPRPGSCSADARDDRCRDCRPSGRPSRGRVGPAPRAAAPGATRSQPPPRRCPPAPCRRPSRGRIGPAPRAAAPGTTRSQPPPRRCPPAPCRRPPPPCRCPPAPCRRPRGKTTMSFHFSPTWLQSIFTSPLDPVTMGIPPLVPPS